MSNCSRPGDGNFPVKGQEVNIFRFCGPHGLCCNYSIVPHILWEEVGRSFQINFTKAGGRPNASIQILSGSHRRQRQGKGKMADDLSGLLQESILRATIHSFATRMDRFADKSNDYQQPAAWQREGMSDTPGSRLHPSKALGFHTAYLFSCSTIFRIRMLR